MDATPFDLLQILVVLIAFEVILRIVLYPPPRRRLSA